MANDDNLHLKSAQQVLAETDRDSYGVVRVLSDSAGTPGEEREYEPGDEALVDSGRAEWVIAPVHLPSAGRRLDSTPGAAEKEPTPLDGVEVYPPAEPTTPQRRSEARKEGYVEAHSDEGVAEKVASKRAEIARENTGGGTDKGDAKLQASLGGLSARSGPVSVPNDLTPGDLVGDKVNEGTAVKSASAKKAAADKSDDKK